MVAEVLASGIFEPLQAAGGSKVAASVISAGGAAVAAEVLAPVGAETAGEDGVECKREFAVRRSASARISDARLERSSSKASRVRASSALRFWCVRTAYSRG